jgi:hypothetical protein
MLSRRNKKLQYFKELSVNAYWLLRQGKLRAFLELFKREATVQFEVLRNRVNNYAQAGIQTRLGCNSQADAKGVPTDLSSLDSRYFDRHKLRPPSYRPTILKRVDPVPLKANPQALKAQLDTILSSVSAKVRG